MLALEDILRNIDKRFTQEDREDGCQFVESYSAMYDLGYVMRKLSQLEELKGYKEYEEDEDGEGWKDER